MGGQLWLTASVAPVKVCFVCSVPWVCFRFNVFFVCVFSLCSFGKQLGGRRGCECITLEPSEMIVVSGETPPLSLSFRPFVSVSLPSTSLSILPHLPSLWYYSCFSIFIWCLYHLFSPVLSPFFSFSFISLPIPLPTSVLPLCDTPLSVCTVDLVYIFKWASLADIFQKHMPFEKQMMCYGELFKPI